MAANSAQEQLMLELINRARMNPAAEAARQGITLNQGLAPGTISASPKQVLAMNNFLVLSADRHSNWMLVNDIFNHNETAGLPALPGLPPQPHGSGRLCLCRSGILLWREHLMDRHYRSTQPHDRDHRPAPVAVPVGGPSHQYPRRRFPRGRHRAAAWACSPAAAPITTPPW